MEEKTINTIETNEEEIEETTGMATTPAPLIGVVSGCKKLNIRKSPVMNNSNVLCVVPVDTKLVIIDPEKAKREWYKVEIPDLDIVGFCMKEYVTIE